MGTFSLFQSPSMRDVEEEQEAKEAGVSFILGVSGSSSESVHLPICFKSLDGVAKTNPGLLSADASRSWSEKAAAGEEDAGDDCGIGSRDGEDGASADVADTWAPWGWPARSGAATSVEGNGRGDSQRAEVDGESIARQVRGEGTAAGRGSVPGTGRDSREAEEGPKWDWMNDGGGLVLNGVP